MPKFVMWMGLAFGLVGSAIMAGGVWSWRSNQAIIDGGIRTEGIVVDLEFSSDSEGGGTYSPVVEFRDRDRRPHTYNASSGSNPPSYSRGEKVQIIYLPDTPEKALIDDFSGRWMLPVFLLVFGGIFATVGWVTCYFYFRRRLIVSRLKQVGVPIDAKFVECYRDTSTTVNGRSPWRVAAQASHPLTGKQTSFTSDPVWVDLSEQLSGKDVPVRVDPKNAKHHHVDLSAYVDEED